MEPEFVVVVQSGFLACVQNVICVEDIFNLLFCQFFRL